MSIIDGAKQVAGGIGRMLIPSKKPTDPKTKDFLHESTEEYAEQLKKRRSRGY